MEVRSGLEAVAIKCSGAPHDHDIRGAARATGPLPVSTARPADCRPPRAARSNIAIAADVRVSRHFSCEQFAKGRETWDVAL
jgi:hypothetical protein